MRRSNTAALALLLAGLPLALSGCAEEAKTTSQRGLPPGTKPIGGGKGGGKAGQSQGKAGQGKAGNTGGSRRSGSPPSAPAGQGPGESEAEVDRPDRPTPELTRDDFSLRTRDPFHNYELAEVSEAPEPVEVVDKQREVKLSEYPFDDLRLIAIVNAGRNVAPTALFLSSSDSKSKSVKQGEYFSSAEVLLASVNRDYIEIEIIDPELTPGWNMERGERRVIYLKE